MDGKHAEDVVRPTGPPSNVDETQKGVVVNASGHIQELDRNFNLMSILSVGIVTGNTWAAIGGSI
ncbi:hypothetical protein LTS18_014124, partial [Coniosporium uncinatum]